MDVKHHWSDWKWLGLAGVLCLGAFLIRGRAWQAGYQADAFGLLGCHFLRFLVLLVAWATLVAEFRAANGQQQPAPQSGVSVVHLAGTFLIMVACAGFSLAWPVVLVLLATPCLVGLFLSQKRSVDPAERAWARWAMCRATLGVLLFTLTWYLAASVSRQALYGLGERIDDHGGSDQLVTWAKEVIAVHQKARRPAWLEPTELPDFVEDLLGRFQGVRTAGVDTGADPSVTLYTGGSAYHFQIIVRPSRAGRDPQDVQRPDEWQPGIYLGTGGK
jgi:hypothetical protein